MSRDYEGGMILQENTVECKLKGSENSSHKPLTVLQDTEKVWFFPTFPPPTTKVHTY